MILNTSFFSVRAVWPSGKMGGKIFKIIFPGVKHMEGFAGSIFLVFKSTTGTMGFCVSMAKVNAPS